MLVMATLLHGISVADAYLPALVEIQSLFVCIVR